MSSLFIYATFTGQTVYARVQHKNEDRRVLSLRNYLTQKKSPLASSAGDLIKVADKYKIDWKLLPAIAGVESGFEMAGNTSDFNPFGYMCGSSPCVFESYKQAIERVGKTLSRNNAYAEYRKTGSILELARTYNYVSPEDWTLKIEWFEAKLI